MAGEAMAEVLPERSATRKCRSGWFPLTERIRDRAIASPIASAPFSICRRWRPDGGGRGPPAVRGALTAVIRRTLEAPDTFDKDGWLRIGAVGHQPRTGEGYISTGSLYLCSPAFQPLGPPADDPFWTDPPAEWTARLAWSGAPFPIDHAL